MDEPLHAETKWPRHKLARIALCAVLVAVPCVVYALGRYVWLLWFPILWFYVAITILLRSRVVLCSMISLCIGLVCFDFSETQAAIVRHRGSQMNWGPVTLFYYFGGFGAFGVFVGCILHSDPAEKSLEAAPRAADDRLL
jgi:hypothetical protein